MVGRSAERLAALPPTFTTAEAVEGGLWRHDLYSLRDDGALYEISRGVYRRADASETGHLNVLAVARRVPLAVVCLLSALAMHELTDEIPSAVQIAVPRGAGRPRVAYPPTEVSEFAAGSFDLGRTEMEVAPGEYIRIYSAARSVVDAMRLAHRVGRPVALHALRTYLSRREAAPAVLLEYAQTLGVEGPVQSAIEVISS